MKKRIIQSLLAIACCVTVALSAIPTAEAAMRASVVTGKVTLNGQVIDNKNAKYPLLIYSNNHLLSHDISSQPIHGCKR